MVSHTDSATEEWSSSLPFTKPISWEEYMAHRPPYPPSMWKLWLSYHQGPLKAAHDVGAGGGVATNDLINYSASLLGSPHNPHTPLKRIYVSDPGTEHLKFARSMLTSRHPPSSPASPEFIFSPTPAEKTGFGIPPGSLDLVMCCEALHWVDVSVGMPAFASSLRPGGTFAAVYYLPFPRILNSESAQRAQTKLLDDFARGTADSAVAHPAWRRGFSQSNVGMDFVPFDTGLWADVRRIEINMEEGKGWPESEFMKERFGVARNFYKEVESGEKGEKERWEEDDWKKEVEDVEMLRRILMKFLGAEEDSELWRSEEWREMVKGAEDVGGKLKLAFMVSMVLARRN